MKYIKNVVLLICFTFFYSVMGGYFMFVSNKTDRDGGGYLRTDFIHKIVDTFSTDILFETGTYNGMTATIASPYFKEIHTVELSPDLYQEACNTFAAMKNVTPYHGNSPEIMKQVLPRLNGRILFWLDAHYSGGKTALGNGNINEPECQTAIRGELQVIKEGGVKDCIILIDDIRLFGTVINNVEYLSHWAYPSIQEICRLGKEINPNFSCVLLGDILLMYDYTKYDPQFSPIVQACTASRLYDGSNLSDEEILEHEKIIMHAQEEERAFIVNLYHGMSYARGPLFHHDLWYGLISISARHWRNAFLAMKKISRRIELVNKKGELVRNTVRYDHWRIRSYLSKIRSHLKYFRCTNGFKN